MVAVLACFRWVEADEPAAAEASDYQLQADTAANICSSSWRVFTIVGHNFR